MIKRIFSIILVITMISSLVPVFGASYVDKKVQAAKGTPIIDGDIDEIWDTTNYAVIDTTTSGKESYTAWMKFLWDENNMYTLSKVYCTSFSDYNVNPTWHDCITYTFDEDMNHRSDDYDICVNFKGDTYIINYDDEVNAKATKGENYFIVEMAVPYKSITPGDGVQIGLDASVRRTDVFGYYADTYAWCPDFGTYTLGTMELKNAFSVSDFNEPKLELPDYSTDAVYGIDRSETMELVENVSVMWDYTDEYFLPVLHVKDYPCLEINNLATVIGATVENGDTIVKDGKKIKFTVGDRLAQDNQGNIMLQCEPVIYQNALYVPVGILEITYIYNIEYNRFKKLLDIIPVHSPKPAEVTFYVKDFGAVGDGKTDDRQAILKALYAAKNCGKPSRVEFEPGKTYYVGETSDAHVSFDITGMKDFVLDGKGCKLIFQQPVRHILKVSRSSRVTVTNITFDATERFLVQGTIVDKSIEDGSLTIKLEDWSPRIAPKEWMVANKNEYNAFGQIMDPVGDYPILMNNDHIRFEDWEELEDGTYKMYTQSSYKEMLPFIEIGYRLSWILNYKNYDMTSESGVNDGQWSAMMVYTSEDILFENVDLYGSMCLGTVLTHNVGNITLRNYNILTHEGEISSSCRDLIHCKNNRGGLLIENGTYIGALDDHINTNGSVAKVSSKLGDRKYSISNSLNIRQGDELLFMETNTGKPLGIALVKEAEWDGPNIVSITLDRDIEGILPSSQLSSGQVATDVYNNVTATSGVVIRNNVFKNGRRHVLLSRSPNMLFENNYAENMGAGIVNLENGVTGFTEASCPSTSTVRNNKVYNKERSSTGHPPMGTDNYIKNDYATVDGALFEGNVLETRNSEGIFLMLDATDLYLINNTIKINNPDSTEVYPVVIADSEIKLIDGLTIESTADLPAAIGIARSIYDPGKIKNIKITGAGKMELYRDLGKIK